MNPHHISGTPSEDDLILTLGFVGLDLSLKTLLKEEIMFTIVSNGTGLIDLTLEASHRIVKAFIVFDSSLRHRALTSFLFCRVLL